MIIQTEPKKERFRVVKSQFFFNFPDGVDPLKLTEVGILQGQRVNVRQPVKINIFESVSYICTSYNDNDTKMHHPFYHCQALSINSNSKIIVLR